jgi:hypothetical protein
LLVQLNEFRIDVSAGQLNILLIDEKDRFHADQTVSV